MCPSVAMLIYLACADIEECDGVHGPCIFRGLGCCLWSVMSQENMLKSVAHAVAKNHIDAHGLCYLQKPYGSP